MNYLKENPDWMVIDIGANIGMFSLFAAKYNRKVIAVEPFIDNIYRMRRAAKLENTGKNIVLLHNAISDKRNEVKLLGYNRKDIGGQGLMSNKNKTFEKMDPTNKYLVETILFDDIVPNLPKRDDGSEFKKAIMKIDIEGFEPYAFTNAKLLFDKIDIQVIFMEWANLISQPDIRVLVLEMIHFLYARGFKAYEEETMKLLQQPKMNDWPFNVIWTK